MTQPKLTRKQINGIKTEADDAERLHQDYWDFKNADIEALADFALKAIDALRFYSDETHYEKNIVEQIQPTPDSDVYTYYYSVIEKDDGKQAEIALSLIDLRDAGE